MKNKKIFNLVLFSTFSAIIIMIGLAPELGYITFIPGIASITIVHIPVLIGIMMLPLSYSIGLGFMFGLSSFITSYIYAGKLGLFDLAFQNILIAFIPRLIFATAAYFIFSGLKAISRKIKHGYVYLFIITSLGAIIFMGFVAEGIILLTTWPKTAVYFGCFAILIMMLVLYFFYSIKSDKKSIAYVPSTFIIATLIHSALVLTFVAVIKPLAFQTDENLFAVILTVLSTNSLVETLVGVLIGTPIVMALYNVVNKEELV